MEKKEQMWHVTMKWTSMSNEKLTSGSGTSRNAGGADFKVCVCVRECITCVNIM